MRVLNFGSLNLDHVYTVEHFVRPGETLSALSRSVKAGGKGLNQSIALARAGVSTLHAGCIGEGGETLRALLEENGVDTSALVKVPEAQGHAIIQVKEDGENCILLYSGANRCVTEAQVSDTLDRMDAGDWLILQNEINLISLIVNEAAKRGLRIVLNPSPYNEALDSLDYGKLTWLLVNEVEAEQITGEKDPAAAFAWLHKRYPGLSVLITLGKRGSMAWQITDTGIEAAEQAACTVRAVDTTAAGDTYTGYFVAGLTEGLPLSECMRRATRAAAISVTRPGAADSIPLREELD